MLQKIRLKIDEPTVDGEAMEGESVPVYFSMYNMGRSSIYNCMVTVEGDGLSLEDSFFQGTVAAGSTMRADFSLITATPGQIDGEIVITYEDSLEEKMEERLPLSLYVSEAYNPDMYPGEARPERHDRYHGRHGRPISVWRHTCVGMDSRRRSRSRGDSGGHNNT